MDSERREEKENGKEKPKDKGPRQLSGKINVKRPIIVFDEGLVGDDATISCVPINPFGGNGVGIILRWH